MTGESTVTPDVTGRARKLWRLLEPIHGLLYFSPEARARFEAVGLKGWWMGYFASRGAAMGPVGPGVVLATFYVFHRSLVHRAIPDAWQLSSPEAVLDARTALAGDTLRGALGELADGGEVARAAAVATRIAQGAPLAGRPFGAAHAALPQPDEPLLALWWAATVLREHRWDGHLAALVAADVGPAEAMWLAAAHGDLGPDGASLLQASRGWPDDEWDAAALNLVARGCLDAQRRLTSEGHAVKQLVEDQTDRAAALAYVGFADDELDALAADLRPLVRQIARSGALPYPNPIGLDPSTTT
jgi:helix-turn-helix protein